MSLSASQERKALISRIQKLRSQKNELSQERRGVDQRMSMIDREINGLQQRIDTLDETCAEPILTEHALLRYLERVRGIDMQALEAEILTESRVEMIKFARSGEVDIQDGHKLILKDMHVVSVV